ncbi:unnamed protein product [Didymodactylos carnosus]|uniref:Uncharacterized protein n=1 Tax=Didymodactylos carnosus TaxID=1234261 RepID=A0A814HGQ6_9BILA|nr:unnamed protein product [Didymodactylos carnosus]CAF1009566.1 unnamed protein product [Didymodactylos carnosus]CAF3616905.1 unnamed protein product [Didymodactylos carnosus]CAF3780714.1 unnamed protein product [Didymodactylos carnosus]
MLSHIGNRIDTHQDYARNGRSSPPGDAVVLKSLLWNDHAKDIALAYRRKLGALNRVFGLALTEKPINSTHSSDNDDDDDFVVSASKKKKTQISSIKSTPRSIKARKVSECDDNDEDIKNENKRKSLPHNEIATSKMTQIVSSTTSELLPVKASKSSSVKRKTSISPVRITKKRATPPPEEQKRRVEQYKTYLNRGGPKHYGEKVTDKD